MTAVAFDTRKLARRLESAGFTREQANGAAEALAETFSAELATKADVAELKGDIEKLRAELKPDIAQLRGEIAALKWNTAQWIISAVLINLLAMIGLVAAVWQLAHK
jgi:outer membrane protein TolC